MKIILTNAFSLNMLADHSANITVRTCDLEEAKQLLLGDWESAVGHQDTADLLANILEQPVAMNRSNLSLKPNDQLVIGQYIGPRLPEGTTTLPQDATIKWIHLTIGQMIN